MNDPRARAIIGHRVAQPTDPQAEPSLWIAADPVPVDIPRPPVINPQPTGHRVPADVDFDGLMQRHGLSPLFVADHVIYRKTHRRRL